MNENGTPVIINKPNTSVIETDLDKFIKFGIVEKTVEVTAGFNVTLHPLSQEEYEQLTRGITIPKTDNEDTLYSRIEVFKIPSLVLSITKLNSQTFSTAEEKQLLKEKLEQAPNTLIDLLWSAYNNICKDQISLLNGGLKKN